MPHPLLQARQDAAREIATAIIFAVDAGLARHGDDPKNAMLIATAFSIAVDAIDSEVVPGFKRFVIDMLGDD